MKNFGSLWLDHSVTLSGHPGLVAESYPFPIVQSGLYEVWVEEGESGAERIFLAMGGMPSSQHGAIIRSGMLNECHGGLLLCDSVRLGELPGDFYDDEDLWNFFADGLCFDGSLEHGGWKSNASDGNIVFVPSYEFYSIAPLIGRPGYAIVCAQPGED